MELRHLRYFVAVAEELHFSRAAARLNISQPPLSQQIRDLEIELGVQLLRRTKRDVQLTEPGRVFLEEARRILSQVEHARRRVAQADLGEIGQLTVATVTSIPNKFHQRFVQVLRAFTERFPEVHLDVRLMNSVAQLDALRKGTLHIGFLTLPAIPEDLAIEMTERNPLAVALPQSHALARRSQLDLPTVAAEPNIIMSRKWNPAFHDVVLAWCRDQDCSLNITHETTSMHMSLTLVSLGLGVALVSASFERGQMPGVVFRRMEGDPPELTSGVVYKRGTPSQTVRAFLNLVREIEGSESMAAGRSG